MFVSLITIPNEQKLFFAFIIFLMIAFRVFGQRVFNKNKKYSQKRDNLIFSGKPLNNESNAQRDILNSLDENPEKIKFVRNPEKQKDKQAVANKA